MTTVARTGPAGSADAGGGALLQLRDVSKTYPGSAPVTALDAVDMDVARGEYLAIVGPSGSGKSTLLNVLGLLDSATAGRYLFGGRDTATMGESARTRLRAEQIGFVFQIFHLIRHRSVTDNVAMGLVYRGVKRRNREQSARQQLAAVGLAHRSDVVPSTLSGGERQRVAIARALAAEPSLLLCDEPTGNLDSKTAGAILETIDGLRRDGLTVVMITHDPDVARRADRTVTIRDGRVTC